MKVEARFKITPDFNRLRGTSFLTKVKFFWRKAWIEIPVIMATSGIGIIGIGMILYTLHLIKVQNPIRKYNTNITIYRPDDPRVKTIRTDSNLDY